MSAAAEAADSAEELLVVLIWIWSPSLYGSVT